MSSASPWLTNRVKLQIEQSVNLAAGTFFYTSLLSSTFVIEYTNASRSRADWKGFDRQINHYLCTEYRQSNISSLFLSQCCNITRGLEFGSPPNIEALHSRSSFKWSIYYSTSHFYLNWSTLTSEIHRNCWTTSLLFEINGFVSSLY